jgi:hypothetical protein
MSDIGPCSQGPKPLPCPRQTAGLWLVSCWAPGETGPGPGYLFSKPNFKQIPQKPPLLETAVLAGSSLEAPSG